MDKLQFQASANSTLGIEVELFIVDSLTQGLSNSASAVMERVGPVVMGNGASKVKHEAFEHTVEIVTDVCTTVAQGRQDLAETLAKVQTAATDLGLRVISCGTHPFSDWRKAELTPDERYRDQLDEVQWIARRAQICSVHFHVGVDDGDKAIAIVNTLMYYHPAFLALSSSSPFYESDDTGLASSRTTVLEAMPTAGFPHLLTGWDEFAAMYDSLLQAGAIRGIREFWWDVRPHPDFGTVELRMCDGLATLDEIASVAALAQCLVTHIGEMIDAGTPIQTPPRWILRENKWLAARYGLEAPIVTDVVGHRQVVRDAVLDLIDMLAPVASRLGCSDELANVARILDHGASYQRQRRVFEQTGSLARVVDNLATELETGRPNRS